MIYLDNSATTRTLDEAADVAAKYMRESFFNPSAAYSPAVDSERHVNEARARLAAVIGAQPSEIIYTSGGTESNNMAISGTLRAKRTRGRLIMSSVEHPSVREVIKNLSGEYETLEAPVTAEGSVDIAKLGELINPSIELVSIMQVNNETGAINDIEAVYKLTKRLAPNAAVHVDGVQGFLKVPFSAKYCDLYSISGHKFHAPKGVGALYARKELRFAGGQAGGGQENDRRSGTTNTPGIMGMDAAIEVYTKNLATYRDSMRKCKEALATMLMTVPDAYINGPKALEGAPHILNISFVGVRGEVLLHALEDKGVYISTGSACSAHKKGRNRILTAMGIPMERQEGAIRISLCPFNTLEEMESAASIIAEQVRFLRKYKRR